MRNDLIARLSQHLAWAVQDRRTPLAEALADAVAALTAQGETHNHETGRVSGLQEAAKIAAAYWHSDPAWNSERIAAAIEERASATPVRPVDSPSDGWRYMRGLSPRSPTPDPGESALTAQGETAPTQLHAAAGAHDRMSAVELELENARIAVSDWHGPAGEAEHLKWRQAQDRLISAAKAAALAPAQVDDADLTATDRLCGCGYRESLHRVCDEGGVYCQLAKARAALASPVPVAEGLRERAEELWEQIGGDLCVCQRQDVPHWCERCQQRITNIIDAITRSRQFLQPVAAEGLDVETLARETAQRLFPVVMTGNGFIDEESHHNRHELKLKSAQAEWAYPIILVALRAVTEAKEK